jgi:two-component system, OmpR family, response regulator MprA
MRVLVIEDQAELAETVGLGLQREGMAVDIALDGAAGLRQAAIYDYDVIVLDRDLPVVHGDRVCETLVERGGRARVLMLTASGGIEDRVAGLSLGADDYLPKPFALEELLARLRALLRRTMPAAGDRVLRFADVTLDARSFEVHRGERKVDLRRMEFLLLELFMLNPRQLLSRTTIYERVWGYDFGPSSNSLDVQLGQLRQRLEADGEPRLIHTIRGMGFILRER